MPNILQTMRVASRIVGGHLDSCGMRYTTESMPGFGSNTGSHEDPSLTIALSSLSL